MYYCRWPARKKNKATAGHLGLLKARLAKLRRELIAPKGGVDASEQGFEVAKTGDARVGFVGFPSVGKYTLLSNLAGVYSGVHTKCIRIRIEIIGFVSRAESRENRKMVNDLCSRTTVEEADDEEAGPSEEQDSRQRFQLENSAIDVPEECIDDITEVLHNHRNSLTQNYCEVKSLRTPPKRFHWCINLSLIERFDIRLNLDFCSAI